MASRQWVMPFREGTIGLFKCFMGKCFDTAEPTCHASISLVRYKVNLQIVRSPQLFASSLT